MGLFDKFKKKEEPKPAPAPASVKVDAPPYQQFCMIDGQWVINPNYDPMAPRPEAVKVYGLDDDDEKEEEDDD